ncbi:hypothetical protein MSAN_00841500 [Mycena sanguinolenta]|uniref:Uncharacterized protein n=1 Tax=Mycena sanguinolenta TaxID=230812 RepID=A0A8H6YZU0_9AGAR|nr:hypothetical protein MSAN_00841500 [Mycena sanguinolenta]
MFKKFPTFRTTRNASALRTARNTLQPTFAILGKLPIPGIDVVAEVSLQALTKVQETHNNAAGWTDLSDRMQSIAFLASADEDMNPALGERLVKVLEDIPESIDASRNHGYFWRFLNSTEDASFLTKHNSTLNDLITDITLEVCIKTNRTAAQLRQELMKYKSNVVASQDDCTKRSGFFQMFRAPIKAAHATVGLRARSGTNMPDAEQNFVGRIEMDNGVVGIHLE